MTITNNEIDLALKVLKEDWETHRDINFVKAICSRITYEIEKLEKEEEQ